ncbi:MAG: sensor histidine kinase [Bacteriovoracaceae bacterium]|nr:sensor histidine kinase [Bacteriovoracaceae bacterium]
MKLKNIKPTYFVAALLIMLNFSFFRWSNKQFEHKTEDSIQSLLRNESLIANSYALSKSILDLEKLEIIKCSELIEDFSSDTSKSRVFYSTLNQNYCYQFKPFKLISEFSFNAQAINGLNYKIVLQLNIPWQSIILELLIDILLILGAFVLSRYMQKQEELALARAKASEIEKQMLLDQTKQIRHDVASPIAAMTSVLDMLTDIDPALKNIFMLSIKRTQELFDQLNSTTNSAKKTPCFVNKILQEIVNEKRISFKDSIVLDFSISAESNTTVLANEMEFKRLLSNLLNNASEACAGRPVKKVEVLVSLTNGMVEIKIADSGKGIPQHLIDKLGGKGISFGKEGHQTAGSGLGLYHAMTAVKSWDGDLTIASLEGQGTTITIKIPLIAG